VIVLDVLLRISLKPVLPELQTSLVRLIAYPAHWFVVQLAPETVTVVPELLAAAAPVKKTVGEFTSHAFVPSAPPQGSNGWKLRKL
jgi:hypothetical protein